MRKPKTRVVPVPEPVAVVSEQPQKSVFEQLLGSAELAEQERSLQNLMQVAVTPVYGLLIISDARRQESVRIQSFGDRVPLSMLRALLAEATEALIQQELKQAQAAPAQEVPHAH